MAKPIKETPILYGKESDKFLKAAQENEQDISKRISKDEYNSSKEIFDAVMCNAKL